jgi:hypothetical protein
MKQFILGAALSAVVFGAAGFAVAMEPARTVPLKLSDLTLDRAFRMTFAIPMAPIVVPGDPNVGFVINYLSCPDAGLTNSGVDIGPVGEIPERVPAGALSQNNGAEKCGRFLESPIIIRPGTAFTISQNFSTFSNVTIAGYFVYPGEV